MSSGIVCVKCGIKASSKCPNCRSTFTQFPNVNVRYLCWIAEHIKPKKDSEFVTLTLNLDSMAGESAADLKSTAGVIAAMPLEDIQQAICSHRWAWQPGCKSSIDCGCTLNPLPEDIRAKFCSNVDNPEK